MTQSDMLRQHVLSLLDSHDAHVDFETAIAEFPANLRSVRPPGAPHTPWQLLEHMRIAQWDILEFSRNARHASPKWPDGYWPPTENPPGEDSWTKSVECFRQDLEQMRNLVADPDSDLFARIPQGDGQTLLREALLVADHNAYHVGQLVLLRRLLRAWP